MDYNLLIYMGSRVLSAININGYKTEHISLVGNKKCNISDIGSFYDNLLDYYNIDDFSEIEINVHILNGGTDNHPLKYLMEKLVDSTLFSIQTVEELLPIVLRAKNLVDKNTPITVQF